MEIMEDLGRARRAFQVFRGFWESEWRRSHLRSAKLSGNLLNCHSSHDQYNDASLSGLMMTTPLALDLDLLPTVLTGAGPALLKRLHLLDAQRVRALGVYAGDPTPDLCAAAGARLIPRPPSDPEIAAARVLFVAGLPPDQSARLAAVARSHRVLVNVEDVLPLCDFHVPAILRRGDLAVSISTGGASPTLSRRLRAYLAAVFPEEWAERIALIADLRRRMRADGASPPEIMAATEALIDREDWLPPLRSGHP